MSARPAVFTYIEFWLSMWNMYLLQLFPRSWSELAPVLMKSVFERSATWPIASAEAEEISPMMQATLSRSIMRSALVVAVCGFTESSLRSSIFRPLMPPAALISATAMSTAWTANSPSGPRNPVRGVRWPMRITSDWPYEMKGKPARPVVAAPARAPLMTVRRVMPLRLLMASLLGVCSVVLRGQYNHGPWDHRAARDGERRRQWHRARDRPRVRPRGRARARVRRGQGRHRAAGQERSHGHVVGVRRRQSRPGRALLRAGPR